MQTQTNAFGVISFLGQFPAGSGGILSAFHSLLVVEDVDINH